MTRWTAKLLMAAALAMFLPWAPAVSDDQSEPATDAGTDIPRLMVDTADELLLLADKLCKKGLLDSAAEACETALALSPECPGAEPIRNLIEDRRATMPKPAAALGADIPEIDLYNSKNLSGWRKIKGRWETAPFGLVCDPGRSDGIILSTKVPKECHGFELRFAISFQDRERGAGGVILGTAGRSRVGVLFEPAGTALWDFKAGRELGERSRRKFAAVRSHDVRVRVRGGLVEVIVRDKTVFEGRLDGWEPGEAGYYLRGNGQIKKPVLIPLEGDLCLERGRKMLKLRNPAEAARLLLRACELEPGSLAAAGLAAEAMDDLGFLEEAGRRARSFLAVHGDERSDSTEIRRLHRTAADIAERAGKVRAELDELRANRAALIQAAAEKELAAGKSTDLEAAAAALRALEVRGEVVEEFQSRIFLAGSEAGGGKPLFNGRDLTGWKRKFGGWETIIEPPGKEPPVAPAAAELPVNEAILASVGDNVPSVLESEPFAAFDRYLIETEQKGTGTYIDQGIRFFVRGEVWSVNLNRFMSRKEITVTRDGVRVYFYHVGANELTSTRWHEVDCLVHMNRLTVILDGRALFTKIMPAAPAPRIGLFSGPQHKGNFKNVTMKPLGRREDYIELLGKLGVPAMEVVECETLVDKEATVRGSPHEQPFAYSGYSLAGALDARDRTGLRFRCKTLAWDDAVLSIRYAAFPAARRGGRKAAEPAVPLSEQPPVAALQILVDGEEHGATVDLPPTESFNDFAYARVPLGGLSHGWHDIRLRTADTHEKGADPRRVLLDRLVVSAEGNAPEEETRIIDSDAAPHFRIRVSPGAQLPENAEEIFALLEVVLEYMVDYYGFEPANPQYYNLISRECWGDPHKGGYATGDNLYVPEETTVRDLSVIMHELSHNFDRGNGYNPPWFGEGKSYPAYIKFKKDTGGMYRAHQRATGKGDLIEGRKAFEDLEFQGENLFQYWGTSKFPYWGTLPDGRNLTSLGYRAANWICHDLAEFLGDDWLKNYFALVRKDIADSTFFVYGDRVEANSVIADYFARSSGKDVAAFLGARRFKIIDIYDWKTIAIDCAGKDRIYLTDAGPSTISKSVDKIGDSRTVSEGSFTYAFPVAPHTKSVTLEITRSGYGSCMVWGKRLFRGRVTRGTETRSFELDDPELWAGARLRLTFSCDTDDELHVAKIVVKKH